METLYRKVTFEIEAQDHNRTILIGKNANFIFNPNTKNGEELTDFLSGCEEIPDPTNQLKAYNIANTFLKPYEKEFIDCLEKLKADKEELLKVLEKCKKSLLWVSENCPLPIIINDGDADDQIKHIGYRLQEIESLIQKHKQCIK